MSEVKAMTPKERVLAKCPDAFVQFCEHCCVYHIYGLGLTDEGYPSEDDAWLDAARRLEQSK